MRQILKAKDINFRFADVSDAEFILSLRTDNHYNQHLSHVDSSVEKQKDWLKKYKERENKGEEFYFIIQRNVDNEPIGTVRLYDFIKDENSFCWGSWILNENKPPKAAVQSAILIYEYAFYNLDFNRSHFDVRKENTGVINFHLRFGAKQIGNTENDFLFHFYKSDYEIKRPNYLVDFM